ncbi:MULTISPECIES: cyanophycin synthetase [Legionella]|uniref:Cyanophycin synthetase n=1 Tax=Legionella septentrionalis TaxID=2498109 RepID=A0A3S0XT02_9GAMM|nr:MULTISPECIES: cyanophycin synthetase [Legionella]MCP0912979.1 cyanophycin synthetase [Legionella sp. 27cVA30]RUQ85324.1 cyanophycin synthetase [Legionella septentrionalis]RUQ96875.1 cyanophycin synthetase [Legionella septentrionalis]RUR15381.1 cyanophycin synthetase [Legionella septentrionalis]
MKILQIKTLKGPNYWSNYRKKLIALKLDLEEYENFPTNLLKGFPQALAKLLPSLYSHRCSRGVEGGFLQRLEEGTWLGHVVEHIALELQTLAGMDCGFGRAYDAHEHGVYHVIFSYEVENAGLYAANAAVHIANTLAQGKKYTKLNQDLQVLKNLYEREKLGPSTEAIVKEAEKRNIPATPVQGAIILGYGCRQKKINATLTSHTSSIGVDIAADKELTKQLLLSHFIPVPRGVLISTMEELDAAIRELGFPLVIKPFNGNHGRGITSNIIDKEKALLSFNLAKTFSAKIIVERFIEGSDYRFLVINYKVAAVAQRTPAMVIGTGTQTIKQLIDEVNKDPRRGELHSNVLTLIKIDKTTRTILAEKNLSLDSILPAGEILYLKDAANLSSGGTATDVTDDVHVDNIKLAERTARLMGLDICGLDVIAKDIKSPINWMNGAIIEVNAAPGLRMHLAPSQGVTRNVAAPIIDMLFPQGKSARIPLIAVTGTNGKTTVVRLIAHLAKHAGYRVGFTTTDGIYINDDLIHEGDCSGPSSAATILHDPWVEFAVLECARGGILRSGLGFDECDVSVITNITSDHLGLNDIHTLEELVRAKGVVARSTKKDGYALLNADDERAYRIKEELICNVALFGLRNTSRIQSHCEAGGLAAYVNNNTIVVQKNHDKTIIASLADIPITFNGKASFMVLNVLTAVLTGIIFNIPIQEIGSALQKFSSSPTNTPGRMNLFQFDNFQVLLDYAHNEGAYIEIKKYLDSIKCNRKIGIISATGDRRPEDIQQLGYQSAQMFDEIIIRHNVDGRGRTNEELTDFLMEGIERFNPDANVKIISDEFEALHYAMDHATPGTFIFYSIDDVLKVVNYMKEYSAK